MSSNCLSPSGTAAPKPRAFGASLPRKEDRRLLTGRGRYTDDLELPQQTYARFVRLGRDGTVAHRSCAESLDDLTGWLDFVERNRVVGLAACSADPPTVPRVSLLL